MSWHRRLFSYLRVERWPLSLQLFLLSVVDLAAALYVRATRPDQLTVSTAAWLLALALFVAAVWSFDQEHRAQWRPLHLNWNGMDTLAVTVAVAAAIPLRFLHLATAPLTIHNDEAAISYYAFLVRNGPLEDFAHLDSFPHTNFWYYVTAAAMWLLGDSVVSGRVLSASLGVLGLLTTYGMAKLLFSRRIAVIALALLTTFHFHIHFSRIAINNIADPLFGTLIFAALAAGVRTRRYTLFAAAGALVGVAFYCYSGARLFVPLIAVVVAAWLLAERKQWRTWRQSTAVESIVLVAISFWWIAAPFIQNVIKDPFNFTVRFRRDGVTWSWLVAEGSKQGTSPLSVLFDQVRHSFFAFIRYPDVDVGLFYDNKQTLLWGAAAVCAGLGFLIAVWRWRELRYQLLLAWFALAVAFGGVLMIHPPSVQRFVTLAPVLCLFMAFTIDFVAGWAQSLWPGQDALIHTATLLLVAYLAADSTSAYFWGYLSRETYGTVHSQRVTLLDRFIDSTGQDPALWFVGANAAIYQDAQLLKLDRGYLSRRSILSSDAYRRDPFDRLLDLAEPAPDQANLYIATPRDLIDLRQVERLLAGGVETRIRWPKSGATILYVYRYDAPRQPFSLSPEYR